MTAVTGSGVQYVPPEATVAYAPASSSGVVSTTPSVNDPQPSAPVSAIAASAGAPKLIPSRLATATAAAGPTCSSRCTK